MESLEQKLGEHLVSLRANDEVPSVETLCMVLWEQKWPWQIYQEKRKLFALIEEPNRRTHG